MECKACGGRCDLISAVVSDMGAKRSDVYQSLYQCARCSRVIIGRLRWFVFKDKENES